MPRDERAISARRKARGDVTKGLRMTADDSAQIERLAEVLSAREGRPVTQAEAVVRAVRRMLESLAELH